MTNIFVCHRSDLFEFGFQKKIEKKNRIKYANADQQVNCRDLQFVEYSSVMVDGGKCDFINIAID